MDATGEAAGLPANEDVTSKNLFEALRHTNEYGVEYWSARDLQEHLGYSKWSNFKTAVRKAVTSCEQSGNDPSHHFADTGKMIAVGKGGRRRTEDCHLSRFACYLIAQNGDPAKPEIANAQKYFAIQTRRQELSDELAADRERIELREEAKQGFKALSGAARAAGVQNRMFGVFCDAGYKGMYGGRGVAEIKQGKGIPQDQDLLDRAGTTELAANSFRYTQTRDKLARDHVSSQEQAIDVHKQVGREVREAIAKIGGAMPENLPAEEHIKSVEKRVKAAEKKLALPDEHAKGLIGGAPQTFDDL